MTGSDTKEAIKNNENNESNWHINDEEILSILHKEAVFTLYLLKFVVSEIRVGRQWIWLFNPVLYFGLAEHVPHFLLHGVDKLQCIVEWSIVVLLVVVVQLESVDEKEQWLDAADFYSIETGADQSHDNGEIDCSAYTIPKSIKFLISAFSAYFRTIFASATGRWAKLWAILCICICKTKIIKLSLYKLLHCYNLLLSIHAGLIYVTTCRLLTLLGDYVNVICDELRLW